MSLRTRLILAFLLLSVVPLTAVTAQHYLSSLDTLHRVARRDAEQMTLELGQRMEMVKNDLSQRAGQFFVNNRAERRALPASGDGSRVVDLASLATTGVAETFGETAALLERIELRTGVPAPPQAPAAGTRADLPAPHRRGGTARRARPRRDRSPAGRCRGLG